LQEGSGAPLWIMEGFSEKKHKSVVPGGVAELSFIALPMVVSAGCDTAMIFIDRLFLSRLGPAQMNAALGGGVASFMLLTFFIGLTGYSTALVAQYLGSGTKHKCAVVITQSMIVCAAAYPLLLALRPLGPWMFAKSGIDPAQLASQSLYFNILVSASIVGLARSSLSCFFSGVGRTRVVMTSTIVSMAVNVCANYVLIFGKLGFPALGIRGAAYGTVLGGACGVAVLAFAYFGAKNRAEFGVGRSFFFDSEAMAKLWRFGSPAGFEFLLNTAAFNAMILAFHSRGPVAATAATVLFNWDLVAFVPLVGMEIGVTSLVGRYMGAGKPDIAHRAAMSGIKIGCVYSAAMLVLFAGFPDTLVNVFRPVAEDPVFEAAAPTAAFMIRLAAVYVSIEAAVLVLMGALRGAGDTFFAMLTSVATHWILVPTLYIMLHVMNTSVESAWIALVAVFMVFSVAIYLRYRSDKWREIKVVSGPSAPPPFPAE